MPKLAPGQSAVLNVTKEARWRVYAGLGWDPAADISLLDKAKALAGGKPTHYDLDLSCYLYDVNGYYITHVSAETGHESDQTGKIYHSGDNTEGLGDGDDEQISIELKELDPTIQNVILIATIKSGQNFNAVTEPEIHLSDGYTGHSFIKLSLQELSDAAHPAFVFARLHKNPDGVWLVQNISAFRALPAPNEWPEILKAYTRL